MKKRRLKPFVKVTLGLIVIVIISLFTLTLNNKTKTVSINQDDFIYVNDYIFDNYYPVMNNSEEKLIRPYTAEEISIYRNFYEKEDSKENQEKSIVLSDGAYIQNSGVDYSSNKVFDVIAALSGVVSNITEDTVLGNTIEIKSDDDITITYQSLSEVSVKKGDNVKQGDIIGKSGTCSINKDQNNTLHIELYKSGQVLNPEKYYNKILKEETN